MTETAYRTVADDPTVPTSLTTCCRAVAQSLTGALQPRRPDPATLAGLRANAAPLPRPTVRVRFRALPQVPREVVTASVFEGVRRPGKVRIGLRSYLVEHPTARVLLDPSIGSGVRRDVLAPMTPLLRAAVTPPADILSTVEALARARIDPAGIDFALSTHLHWDHVSGLLDLPALPLVAHRREYEWATAGPLAPAAGVRPALAGRTMDLRDLDGPPVLTFGASHDVFGDGSVLLVDLAGHTPGSVGVLLHEEAGWVLMAGDAVWHSIQLTRGAQKAGFPGLLVDDDRSGTFETMQRLIALDDEVLVVPCHDHDLTARWAGQP